ncbi:MAG: two-component system response regulator [Candidatus Omnitrophica bacterium CG11_big_fil_rev_8_21_14_0_20_42_13]|uniref:Two-component system response regulator n=1 Tax=Candidatus Ghiorseimicrobium undicola TaxID=1974746 RepID=A0A2H0LWB6_9BACT|nr:MAG: two-component system response regulator [Candidatus Omnitrophica bacterium CG11_big_fil_rev_8_21_14_0_20_42_13]
MNTSCAIYIVDDDESVRTALGRLLRSCDFNVEAFNSAREFLDFITPEAEGILLLDIRMPSMDGFELQEKLNALGSRLKIIFITAHAGEDDRERAMRAHASGFLQKPFSDEVLLGLINALMPENAGGKGS